MVAGCMDDIGDDDDEDLDDPDLLAELIEVADEPEPVMQPVKQPPPIVSFFKSFFLTIFEILAGKKRTSSCSRTASFSCKTSWIFV